MTDYRIRLLACALAAACAMPAAAQPQCAGFTDVLATSGFCPNVEWLKNRGITLGCTGTEYCPGAAVSRLAMAAFMNRLGNVLTPVTLSVDGAPGALDLDAGPVVCATADVVLAGYPRRVMLDALLSATAPAPADFVLQAVVSADGGGTWTPLAGAGAPGGVGGNAWGVVAALAQADLGVSQTVRFGARALRGSHAGAVDLSDSRCQLRVMVYSRTGTESPY